MTNDERDALLLHLASEIERLTGTVSSMQAAMTGLAMPGSNATNVVAETNLTGLPPFDSIYNAEFTFFDNGARKGAARYTLKTEINLSRKTFSTQRRDVVEVAELFDLIAFEGKLSRKSISDGYRERLRELMQGLWASKREPSRTLIGMYGRRGGTGRGVVYFEDQYLVATLGNDGTLEGVYLNIGGEARAIEGFRDRHPVTGKAFASEAIKAKAIWCPDPEDDEIDAYSDEYVPPAPPAQPVIEPEPMPVPVENTPPWEDDRPMVISDKDRALMAKLPAGVPDWLFQKPVVEEPIVLAAEEVGEPAPQLVETPSAPVLSDEDREGKERIRALLRQSGMLR